MTFANAHPDGMTDSAVPSSTFLTAPIVPPDRHPFLKAFGFAVAGALALFLASLFLPDPSASVAQDLMCWFVLGAAGAGVLIAGVRLLDGFLDL